MNPRTYYELDVLKDSTNQPLQPPPSYQELRKFRTNQIGVADTQGSASNASKVFIGDFRNLLYGVRTDLRIDVSDSAGSAFEQMEYLVRAFVRMDLAVLRENHFTRIKGIIPA